MHPAVAPPSVGDILELIAYVLGNPYMFIGSTTVMTTSLVVSTFVLAAAAAAGSFVPSAAQLSGSLLRWLAPKLSIVLAYFGIGSIALATQILVRFHADIPYETELQFRSGAGHLVVAVIGVGLLLPHTRGLRARDWVAPHFWALGYLTFHVLFLTPPWFYFQGQGELVLSVVHSGLALAFAATVLAWWLVDRGADRAPQLAST